MKKMASKMKMISTMTALTLTTMLFAGCGSGNTGTANNTTTETPKQETTNAVKETEALNPETATELELWTFIDAHERLYSDRVTSWNEENPDRQVTLKVTVLPYEDLHTKLTLALQSGKGAPDLCDIEISKFPNYLKGDIQLVDLTDCVEPYREDIVKSRLEIYQNKGKQYGLPSHVGATVMYYNTEILEQAGVDYTTIKTWDDYMAAGEKVLDTTGVYMGTADTSGNWMLQAMLAQQKSDLVDEEGYPNVDTPEVARGLTKMKEMYDAETLVLCPGGQPDTDEGKAFINGGNVASVLMPLWYMSRFTDTCPDLDGKMVIAPVPTLEEGMPRSLGLGGTGLTVTKQSKDIELAKEVATWAKLTEEATIAAWEVLGFDPVNTDVWMNKDITHDPNNIYVKYFITNPFDILNEIKGEIELIKTTFATPAINELFTQEILSNLFESDGNPVALLKSAQAQLENEVR